MNKTRIPAVASALALIVLSVLTVSGQSSDPAFPIRGEDVYAWCKYLAGPQFEGRLMGTEGYAAAARWAASKMKEWGLRPLDGLSDHLISVPCSYTSVDMAELTIIPPPAASPAAPKPAEAKLVVGTDFLPYFFSGAGEAEAEAVFAGWGINAPELGYDDYAGLDVKGKFILCFQGAPASRAAALVEANRHAARQKTARDKGAVGIFYIQTGVASSPNGEWAPGFLPGLITAAAADRLFADRGMTSAEVLKALRAFERPMSFAFKSRLRYKVASRHFAAATGYNVVGLVPGSDPALRSEAIVVGGHLDHLGRHLGETYFGANDNASGSANVLGLAKAFRGLKTPPKRTVIFALFGGEEMGYLGARAFIEKLPPSIRKVEAMLNFDMNGIGGGLTVYITPGADRLRSALAEADAKAKILGDVLEINTRNPSGSDYVPFVQRGIPVLSLFSNDFTAGIHVPADTIYRINPDIMADVANEAFRTIRILADR